MKCYECVFITKQDIPIQKVYKITDSYQDLVLKMKGKVIKKEYWGLRILAYLIKKNKKGHYIFFKIYSDNALIKTIKNDFKINEHIIKFLIIRIQNNKTNFISTKQLIV